MGLYPHEEVWRPQVCVLLISALLGLSWRMWGGTARGFAIGFGAIMLVVGALPHEMETLNRVLVLVNPVAVAWLPDGGAALDGPSPDGWRPSRFRRLLWCCC